MGRFITSRHEIHASIDFSPKGNRCMQQILQERTVTPHATVVLQRARTVPCLTFPCCQGVHFGRNRSSHPPPLLLPLPLIAQPRPTPSCPSPSTAPLRCLPGSSSSTGEGGKQHCHGCVDEREAGVGGGEERGEPGDGQMVGLQGRTGDGTDGGGRSVKRVD